MYLPGFYQAYMASLTINENANPTVRKDFEMYFSKVVPENDPAYLHDDEGPDDIACTFKSSNAG